jgi:predicted adenylyl cyclase CyaB
MRKVEVELRAFVSKDEYERLIRFMSKNGIFVKRDYQITYYFSGPHDLRIQKNRFYAKLWLKLGKLHDVSREEIEIKFKRKYFDKLLQFLEALGYQVEVKWFRKRRVYKWNGTRIALDHTKGYGYVVEVEKSCLQGDETKAKKELNQVLSKLSLRQTPRGVFTRKFNWYKRNWKNILGESNGL